MLAKQREIAAILFLLNLYMYLKTLRGARRKQELQPKILHSVKFDTFDTSILRSEVEVMTYCATGYLFD